MLSKLSVLNSSRTLLPVLSSNLSNKVVVNSTTFFYVQHLFLITLEIHMKLIHKVMILNVIILVILSALVIHTYQADDLGCITDTECEAQD